MLALDRAGTEMVLMAPNIDQMHVVNHYTGQEMDEFRNVLVESDPHCPRKYQGHGLKLRVMMSMH